jgi:hypothetical protein
VSPLFWGTTISPRAALLPTEAETFAATPNQVIVWPGAFAGDQYDPIANRIHTNDGGSGAPPPVSEAQFASYCELTNCTAIVQVPGEIDDPAFAGAVVNYTVNTLGLHPAYWEIGNEPGLWMHWGEPWTNWRSFDRSTPTPMDYANEVQSYILKIRQFDPGAKIIGLPGVGKGSNFQSWITDVIRVNSYNLSGVAFHEYPANSPPPYAPNALNDFYTAIQPQQASSIPSRAANAEQYVANEVSALGCSNCSIPLFVTEIGSGLSHITEYQPLEEGFPGAIDMAAQITEALNFSLASVDLYASVLDAGNSWFSGSGTPRPVYTLYTDVLKHLGTTEYPVSISAPGVPGLSRWLYAIATTDSNDSNRSDFLAVNTNTQYSVSLSGLPSLLESGPTEVWEWDSSTMAPVPRFYSAGLPSTFILPANSLALFEAYPQPAAPVTFTAVSPTHGPAFVNGTQWFVSVNGSLYGSNTSNLTVLLPSDGTYGISAPPLPVIVQRTNQTGYTYKGALNGARIEPYPTLSSITLGTSPVSDPILFVHQWQISVIPEPASGGAVVPPLGWADADTTVNLTAEPFNGYLFSRWFGWGLGSFNGTSLTATLVPEGQISEKAIFKPASNVNFTEVGLPSGTPWSVALRGVNESSTNATIVFFATNGTYGYRVGNVSGYRAQPPAGSVNVTGTPINLSIDFVKLHPPPGKYPVSFVEMGLPSGTNWSVTVRGGAENSTQANLTFFESNGTYGYAVGTVAGYRAHPSAGSFTVVGGPLNVTIAFTPLTPPPPRYSVTFFETGLATGTNWSVGVRGNFASSMTSTITFPLSNGSYGFTVGNASGYRAHPPSGGFTVAGAAVDVSITFVPIPPPPAEYQVLFLESGLPVGTNWSVTLRGVLNYTTTAAIAFEKTNGTYGFRLGNVTGYRAHPPAGSITVAGGNVIENISFTRLTPPPPKYLVSFQEAGLPAGTNWSVIVRGALENSSTSTITFEESNGTYGFNVSYVPDYRPVPRLGSFNVSGADTAVSITYVKETPRPPAYAVSFQETGLPTGTLWSVTVRGAENSSSTDTIGFQSSNGTWGFRVGVVSGYRSVPTNSSYTVNGGPITITVTFYPVHGPTSLFQVTFTESGLSAGTNWSVTVRNVSYARESSSIVIPKPNGTYGFQVSPVPGYVAHPARGGFSVTGGNVHILVRFVPVTTAWKVTWKATGIWNATWWVVLNATPITGTGSWRSTPLHNGSYDYTIEDSADFVPTPRVGSLLVQGHSLNVSVKFVRASFPIVFSAKGIPTGTAWHVRLADIDNFTSSLEAHFERPNGTYTFDVEAPSGYYANLTHGNLTVRGAAQVVSLQFIQLNPPAPSVWSLGSRALAVAIVFAAAVWGGFALMGRVARRNPKGPHP